MSLRFDRLYAGDSFTVTDARCRPHESCCGAEEVSSTNDIVFPRRGCFVRHVGRSEATANANTVLFFRRHEPYRVSHPVLGGDDCTCLSYAPAVLTDAFRSFDDSVADHPDTPFRTAGTLSASQAFVELSQLRRTLRRSGVAGHEPNPLLVDEMGMKLLESLARDGAGSTTRPQQPARFMTDKAHRELADNACVVLFEGMSESLTLASIARRVHSSPFHLARVFRRVIGLSLHQYLTRLRLRTAVERLADGEADLTALALALGFSTHSHFSDSFRREFHVTPSAFRLGL